MKINRRYFKIFRSGGYGRFPVVKQHDRTDCGPAALLSVLRYYGGDSSLARLRSLCQTGAAGSTMLDLITAARSLGLEASGVRGEYSDLVTEKMPCLAHVIRDDTSTHYVVVYAIDSRSVLLGDPARGLYKLSRDNFLKIWPQRVVILLKPGAEICQDHTPVWLEWLWPFIGHDKSWIVQSVFLGMVYSVLSLVMAMFVQKIIDVFIPSADLSKIIISGVLLVFVISMKSVLGYYRQFFLLSLNTSLGQRLNTDFLDHVLHLPRSLLDSYQVGDITSRLYDIMRIQQGVVQIIGTSIIDLMILAGSLILIFCYSVQIGLMLLPAILVYTLFLAFNLKKLNDRQHEVVQSFSEVQATFINTIQGYDDILNFNAGGYFSEKNRRAFNKYQQQARLLGLSKSRLAGGAEELGSIMILVLLIIGAVWVVGSGLLVGQLMACFSLLSGILPALNRLIEGSLSWQVTAIAVERILDLLQMDREKDTGASGCAAVEMIKVKNAAFQWSARKHLFTDVSLDLVKGRLTALWGPIGSGKSTLMQLLLRKYLLSAGKIKTGLYNSTELNLTWYREKIGMVPQQVKIFNGTLVENILLGRRKVFGEKFAELLSRYKFNEYIMKFDHGLLTMLGDNSRHLSGGELQMLGLIRALLYEPDVLMIDEGLNALDAQMEKTVFELIRQYARDHLVLISTHNLNVIRQADYVYVLDRGTILESGTPDDLLFRPGSFKEIWQAWNHGGNCSRAAVQIR